METIPASKRPPIRYKQGFIETRSAEDTKASLQRELTQISDVINEVDVAVASKSNSVYKGEWNPVSGAYPDANFENSYWDVKTNGDTDYVWNGLTWKTYQTLIYDQLLRTYRQVEERKWQEIKTKIDELRVSTGGSDAAIRHEEEVRANADAAMAQSITTLTATVTGNKTSTDATIATMNKTISDNTTAIATTNQQLTSKITAVDTKATQAQADIVTANNTIATLTSSTAQNDLALRSSITATDAKATEALNNTKTLDAALKVTNKTVADNQSALSSQITSLRSTVTSNAATDKEATDQLRADLTVTNTAVSNLSQSTSSSITQVQASVTGANNYTASVEQKLTATTNRVGVVESHYALTLNSNGKISGVTLNNGAGGISSCDFLADKFTISDGNQQHAPFVYQNGELCVGNLKVLGTIYAENIVGDVGSEAMVQNYGMTVMNPNQWYTFASFTIINARPYARQIIYQAGSLQNGASATGSWFNIVCNTDQYGNGSQFMASRIGTTQYDSTPVFCHGTVPANWKGKLYMRVWKDVGPGWMEPGPGSIRLFKASTEVTGD